MILPPLQLASGFMFLCVLLLLAIVYGRINWIFKSGLVSISLLFCYLAYNGYQSTMGYPVSTTPPEIFKLEWSIVHEPFPLRNDPGAIFLWLIDPNGRMEPRSIVMPYSKRHRAIMLDAKKRIQGGESVYMSFKKHSGKDGNSSAQPNDQKPSQKSPGGGNSVPYTIDNGTFDFTQPPDTLPKKSDNDQEE